MNNVEHNKIIKHYRTLSQQFMLDKPINKKLVEFHINALYRNISSTAPKIKYVSNPKQANKYAAICQLKQSDASIGRFTNRFTFNQLATQLSYLISPNAKYESFHRSLGRAVDLRPNYAYASNSQYFFWLELIEKLIMNHQLMSLPIEEKIYNLYYIFKHISYCLFYNDTVIVSENPETITFNENTVHSIKDAAIIYDSSFKLYVYKGNVLNREMFAIIKPNSISKFYFNRISDRRLLDLCLDVKGREWLFSMFNRECIDYDQNYGRLWQVALKYYNIAYLEVVNGSPEPDGTYKTYWLRVPGETTRSINAVAWTYGMTSIQYLNLVKRT